MERSLDDKGGSILILDPSCVAGHGHHLKSICDLLAAIAPKTARIVVGKALPQKTFPADLDDKVDRLFTTSVYDEPGVGPRPNDRMARRTWKLRRAAYLANHRLNWAASAMAGTRSGKAALAHEDWEWASWRRKWPSLEAVLAVCQLPMVSHVVVPSSDVELLCGLIDLRAHHSQLCNAVIHARIITASPTLLRLTARATASAGYQRLMAERMRDVHVYVETHAMQRHVLEGYGLATDVYPYLLASPPGPFRCGPRSTAQAAFAYFGAKRNEKGFHRLLPILRQVAAERTPTDPTISVLVHASDAGEQQAQELRAAFQELTGPGFAIELLTGALSEADYATRFAAADAVLLPYTGARYALSGSGIVCEALAMGKSIILPPGLGMAEYCTRGNAITAATDSDFARAILTMARNIDRFRSGSQERALAYAQDIRGSALLRRLAE